MSSNYDGAVCVWDTSTGTCLVKFQVRKALLEDDYVTLGSCRSMRRGCGQWYITQQNPIFLPLGQMIAQVIIIDIVVRGLKMNYFLPQVKLWSSNRPQSCYSFPTKDNVCCVQFHPTNCYNLAYGSAG